MFTNIHVALLIHFRVTGRLVDVIGREVVTVYQRANTQTQATIHLHIPTNGSFRPS